MCRDVFWAGAVAACAVIAVVCSEVAYRATLDRDLALKQRDTLIRENLQLRAYTNAHVREAVAGVDPAGPDRIPPADLPLK